MPTSPASGQGASSNIALISTPYGRCTLATLWCHSTILDYGSRNRACRSSSRNRMLHALYDSLIIVVTKPWILFVFTLRTNLCGTKKHLHSFGPSHNHEALRESSSSQSRRLLGLKQTHRDANESVPGRVVELLH